MSEETENWVILLLYFLFDLSTDRYLINIEWMNGHDYS